MSKKNPKELKHPKEITWYIAWDKKEIKVYGSVSPENHFTTPWQKVDFYSDQEKWKTVLEKNGIELDELI
jgi:hypothetical protein